jgi:hypothetical protein
MRAVEFQFNQSTFPVQLLPGQGNNGLRRFSGVGYTGAVIERHPHWGNVVFDMSNITLAARVPILLEHDESEIVGYADSHTVTSQGELVITGVLSASTNASKKVTGLSDEGFPWQMSVHIEPEYVEFIEAGKSVEVNGRNVQGPVNVFRNGKIGEVSFTSMGWDSATTAEALSQSSKQLSMGASMATEKTSGSTEAEDNRVSMLMSQNEALQKELNDYKKKFSEYEEERKKKEAEENMSRLKQAFSECGSDRSDEDMSKYSAFSKEAVDAMIDALTSVKANFSKQTAPAGITLPPQLTTEVVTAGDTTRFSKPADGFPDRLAARFKKGAN